MRRPSKCPFANRLCRVLGSLRPVGGNIAGYAVEQSYGSMHPKGDHQGFGMIVAELLKFFGCECRIPAAGSACPLRLCMPLPNQPEWMASVEMVPAAPGSDSSCLCACHQCRVPR